MHFFITSGPHKIEISLTASILICAFHPNDSRNAVEVRYKKRKEATFEKGTNLKEEVVNNGLTCSL